MNRNKKYYLLVHAERGPEKGREIVLMDEEGATETSQKIVFVNVSFCEISIEYKRRE